MGDLFTLPGAERFARCLRRRYIRQTPRTDLVLGEPRRVREFGHWGKQWQITTTEGTAVGTYTRYNAGKDKPNGIRVYNGVYPGYINMAVVRANVADPEHRIPRDTIRLCYAEAHMKDGESRPFHGPISEDGFARIDGHETIPFP